MSERVFIFDTTLRDGEQSPGCSMNIAEKVRFAQQLEDLGVDIIEAGFPIASEGDALAVRAVSEAVQNATVAGLSRCKQEDIDAAARSLEVAKRSRLHLFLATSDIHLEYKLKISRSEVLQQAAESVSYARNLFDEVEFSPEDSTRADRDFLVQMVQTAVDAGATIINVADTVGYATPTEYESLIRELRARVQGIDQVMISVHCHNDLGLAVANSLAGLMAGARQVECTINGIGERAGNASLEEIAMAMHVRGDCFPFKDQLRRERLFETSQMLSSILGFEVQPNKAIVGRNAFAHEAGIHQHGVLSNPLTYEIMTPESVGVPVNRLVLGKHSGRHALRARLEELGFQITAEELGDLYQRFIELADKKKSIYDQDLIWLVRETEKTSAVMQ
jgi:2-isopropylmalate synthase